MTPGRTGGGIFAALAITLALAISAAGTYADPPQDEVFLFARTGGARPDSCSDDPLEFRSHAAVVAAVDELELGAVRIRFFGCRVGEFQTSAPPGIDDGDFSARIYYPLSDTLTRDDYIGPLLHELSHVFQVLEAGSMAELRRIESRAIALGADFMVGLVAARTAQMDMRGFQANVALIGRYRESSDAHGNPAQRSGAFRFGYFYDRNNDERGIHDAHELFQNEFVHEILDR